MSRALASAAPLTPQIRLAQAVSHFQADLSTEQKAIFCANRDHSHQSPPDISDVMRLTAEIDLQTSGKFGGGRCFGPRFFNALQAVQHFASLGDIIVGGAQNIIACGVWALVRMTLLSVANFASFLDRVSILFMFVGRSAPRYERMALLYPKSKALQSQLSEYFIVVVRLCHQLLKLSKKSILGQLVSYPNDSEMKNYQSELDRWATSIREEVSLLIGEEQSSRFKVLLRFSETESHRRRIKARCRVLDSCSTYDYQTTWKEIRKAGNTTLHNQASEYRDWKTATGSCTLVCTGKLGSGKSVLLANVVSDLNHTQRAGYQVAYFFCRYNISESLKARTVLGSLAGQFLHPVSDLTTVEELLDDIAIPDLDGIWGVLKRALPTDFKAYCVIDGLDECDETQREIIVRQLRELQESFALVICVSFRLEAGNALYWKPDQFAEQRTMAIPVDNPDIRDFISAELETRIISERLKIGDPSLIIEIQDALVQGAHGMFLWVALQIESLGYAKTDEAIRQALADLPKDLPETFSRILRRSGELGKDYQTRVLELVTVAQRPLTTEELREALSVVPGDDVWNPSRLLNDIYSALACCGSLIIVDEEAATVRLTHHSVKQFLFDEESSMGAILTMERANARMADVVITYLNYNVFDTQLSTTVVPKMQSGAAPSKVIQSMDAPSQIRTLALKLLRSRRHPDFDMGKIVADTSRDFKSPLNQFPFHSYAKEYWLRHANCVPVHDVRMYKSLLKLLQRDNDMDIRDDESETLLLRAAENGHEAVVQLLVEKGADLKIKDKESGLTPLLWAATNGHEGVVELLLATGKVDADAKDTYGQTPLSWAARNGHEAIIQLLLATGKVDADAKDNYGQTPLFWAAAKGHQAIVKILLATGKEKDVADAADGGGAAPWTSGCGKFGSEVEHDYTDDLVNNAEGADDRWSVFVDNDSARKFWAEVESPDAFPPAGQPPALLCHRCESLPVSDQDLELFLQPAALAKSSAQCELCSLLYTALSPGGAVYPARTIRLRREGSNLLADGYDRPVLRLCTSLQWKGDDIIQIAPSVLLEKSSDAFFALLAKWLRDCDDGHEEWGCHGSKLQPPLPTRVIDVSVGNEGKANSDIRLVHSWRWSRGRYVALSYLQGYPTQKIESNRTLKSNLEDRCRNISFAELSNTFQDAIIVTRRLGLRYLWIDSFCIVQDDLEDWKREAGRIPDIFHQAYCTIAATAAKDTQAGFLRTRPTSRSVAVQISQNVSVHFCESVDDFRSDVEHACLSQRAWVLQERALSRRTIHFGINQTYWECGRGIICETLARLTNQKARFLSDPQFPSLIDKESLYTRHHAFQSIFEMYSRQALTYPTDRPIAIAGIESRLAATLRSSVAFGIFGAHFYLHRSLLWQRSDEDTLLKPIDVVVPSWSWMAYDGAIKYLDIPPRKVDWNTEIDLNNRSQLSAPVVDFAVGEMLRDMHRLVFDCRRTAVVQDLKCVVVGRQSLSSRSGEDEETRTYYILVVSPVYKEGSCIGYERLGIASVRKAHIAMDDGHVRASLL